MINEIFSIILEILIYFLVSLFAMFVGRKVLDLITPYDLNYQTSEAKNTAVGLTQAGFYLALAIIVHASLSGEVNYELFSYINEENPSRFSILTAELITTVIYVIIGLLFLSYGRRVVNWITPFDINKELESKNIGVGIILASYYVAVSIIIHAIIA